MDGTPDKRLQVNHRGWGRPARGDGASSETLRHCRGTSPVRNGFVVAFRGLVAVYGGRCHRYL